MLTFIVKAALMEFVIIVNSHEKVSDFTKLQFKKNKFSL